jgi:hypothetical protein
VLCLACAAQYLSDDIKLECQGTTDGKARCTSQPAACACQSAACACIRIAEAAVLSLPLPQICAAKNPGSFPSFMGV